MSRRRYERERAARLQAEQLLEAKSLELYEANIALQEKAASLSQTARALRREKTKAETANAAKSAFLAKVSHEIRTPMNAVLGMASALTETKLEDPQRDMVDTIVSAGHVLTRIVSDVLDITKIEVAELSIEAVDFDIRDLVEDVVKLFRAQTTKRDLVLTESYAPDLPQVIRADSSRIRQVLSNLLSNALKFTNEGEICISVAMKADLLNVEVSDTGSGIPEHKQAHLFQPYQQLGDTPQQLEGGTGLGLAISHHICRRMGGDLTFSPSRSGGAQFTATFRVSPVADISAEPKNLGQTGEEFFASKRWRILAAEDNRTNQKVLALLLKRYDVDLRMVDNGQAAVDAFFENPADIVLMDINMPVMDGLEAADRIREGLSLQGNPPVPVIALTANVMAHQVEQYARAGVQGHVPKPVKREALVSEMVRLLSDHAS